MTSDLWERLPATAELALFALVIAAVGGITLGVVSARRQNRPTDHAARLVALVGSSLPVFWLGLIVLYVFYVRLGWFPGPGRLPPRVDAPPENDRLLLRRRPARRRSRAGVAAACAS